MIWASYVGSQLIYEIIMQGLCIKATYSSAPLLILCQA